MTPLYFDYNATTPVDPAVRDVMLPYLSNHFGNPSSDHALGRECRIAIDEARGHVASLLGAKPGEIVFTSGGTESNNLSIMGTMLADFPPASGHMIVSAFEHPAVIEPAKFLEEMGFDLSVVGCDRMGIVDPDDIRRALRDDTRLVSVMHSNNEIGALQPIGDIAKVCSESGVTIHTDAAQSIGKVQIDVEDLQVDLLSIAGHKLYGPTGIGALYIRSGVKLRPYLRGAGHESGVRPGTESVAMIAGLGEAARLMADGLEERASRQRSLRDLLHARLVAGVGDGISRNGAPDQTLPNTLSVNFPGVIGQELLARVPSLCASTGSACHSSTEYFSDTQLAINLLPEVAAGTVRLSLGKLTTEEEVEEVAMLLISAWKDLVAA
jgi:cysteine desulfurase